MIVEILTDNNSIVELCLTENAISNCRFEALVEGIMPNSQITSLALLKNNYVDNPNLVRYCADLIERNGVMKQHQEQVEVIGIAHCIVLD